MSCSRGYSLLPAFRDASDKERLMFHSGIERFLIRPSRYSFSN